MSAGLWFIVTAIFVDNFYHWKHEDTAINFATDDVVRNFVQRC